MNNEHIETRTTAYVLGELSNEQRVAFEKELRDSESLRQEVNEIRETLAAVKAELENDAKSMNALDFERVQTAIETTGACDSTSQLAATVHTTTRRLATRRLATRRLATRLVLAASVLLVAGLYWLDWMSLGSVAITDSLKSNGAISGAQQESMLTDEFRATATEDDARTNPSEFAAARSEFTATLNELESVIVSGRHDANSSEPSTESVATESKSESAHDAAVIDRIAGQADASRQNVLKNPSSSLATGAVNKNLSDEAASLSPALPGVRDFAIKFGPETGQRSDATKENAYGLGSSAQLMKTPQRGSEQAAGEEAMDAITFSGDEAMMMDSRNSAAPALAMGPTTTGNTGFDDRSRDAHYGTMVANVKQEEEFGNGKDRSQTDVIRGQMRSLSYERTKLAEEYGEAHPTVRRHDREIEAVERLLRRSNVEDARLMMEADSGRGPGEGGDQYEPIQDNPFMEVKRSPLSTFSVDVDTASYAKVRMYLLQQHSLPRPDAVRIEELVNYFTYDYPQPTGEHPFAASIEVASCPWNPSHRLARIGIQGKAIEKDRPRSNLVFLLDVSGSMDKPNKLPLVVDAMKMLSRQLSENDSVAIVVYAGAAGVVLDSTSGDQRGRIIDALDRLIAGGSTNGGRGISLAYQLARDHFVVGGTNRVILCTDGDFNVGVTGTDQLVRIAEKNAKSDIFLSVLGFGMGNHNDSMMEQISNRGNGNYAFIDSKSEARRVLVQQLGGTLITIAKDVKVQVEFNPKEVSAYRLIGYENRLLAAQDFNDDKKDAGEIGAGHSVTALYELVPASAESDVTAAPVDDLRYQKKNRFSKAAESGELMVLKLRYKQPTETTSQLVSFDVTDSGQSFSETDADFQFAAAVAQFGMLLRDSPFKGNATFDAVREIASHDANTKNKSRAEFLEMVGRAKQLAGE